MGADTTAYQVRGFTLHRLDDGEYGMFRHSPENGVPVPLPAEIRVAWDQNGKPIVHRKLAPTPGTG